MLSYKAFDSDSLSKKQSDRTIRTRDGFSKDLSLTLYDNQWKLRNLAGVIEISERITKIMAEKKMEPVICIIENEILKY